MAFVQQVSDCQACFLFEGGLLMTPSLPIPSMVRVAVGEDRFGEQRGLGVSVLDFKIAGTDNQDIFVIENVFHAKEGPARHLHYEQDEWFYLLEGEFRFEVGSERFEIR